MPTGGYEGEPAQTILASRGYLSRVRRKKRKRGRPPKNRRWVVEAAHSCFNRFRKLLVRYEKLVESYEALVHLAAAIICWRKVAPGYGSVLRHLADRYLSAPGSNRGYASSAFMEALVLLLQAGGQRLEDLRELEQEAGLIKLVDREVIPDPDTVGDGLRSACALHADRRMGDPQTGERGLIGLGHARDILNQRILWRDGIKECTLGADAIQIAAEKREATWTCQGVKGYMPMSGFLFETPVRFYEEFREGHVAPSIRTTGILPAMQVAHASGQAHCTLSCRFCVVSGRLGQRVRGGRGYWAITADQDQVVKKAIQSIPEAGRKEAVAGFGYEIAETVHTLNRTPHAFRLVVKRELCRQPDLFASEDRYFYHVVGRIVR